MDKRKAVDLIYPGVEYNPACFEFSEAEARAKKLWRDARPMPTDAELQAALDGDTEGYKERRKKDYRDEGLTFEKYVELLIENDNAGMAQFRAQRDVIKARHPKGNS